MATLPQPPSDSPTVKVCTKCGEEKPATTAYFYARGDAPHRLRSHCKDCKKVYDNSRQAERSSYGKSYREANRDRLVAHAKEYRQQNLEDIRRMDRQRNKRRSRQKVAYNARRLAERRASEPGFRLIENARRQCNQSLRSGLQCPGFFRHMPYTKDEFVAHLLSTLPEGYNESDICDGSKLHIDHIRPVSSFNLTGEIDDEFLECWSLSNLQLLPANENMKKSNKRNWKGCESNGSTS